MYGAKIIWWGESKKILKIRSIVAELARECYRIRWVIAAKPTISWLKSASIGRLLGGVTSSKEMKVSANRYEGQLHAGLSVFGSEMLRRLEPWIQDHLKMKDPAAVITLLSIGTLSFLTGCSTRVWKNDETRFRIGAIIFGLICIAYGGLALFGLVEIQE